MIEQHYLTLREAAERLGWSYNTIKKYVHNGSIPAEETKKVGKNRMIAESWVKDMEGRAVLKRVYRRAGH